MIVYRIEWINMNTGERGGGWRGFSTIDKAFSECVIYNREFPYILHYPQAVRKANTHG